ncbi:MAG: carboxypeptidase-like regulatory domain-containing protein, partial [Coriobacteriales bacterium]
MLLTTSASLSDAAAAKLNANKATISKATFIGGTGALSAYTRNQVKAILTGVTPPASGDTNPFVVPSMEWDPAAPDTWEIGPAGIEFETYGCGNCHHLGWVAQGKKPTVGNFVSTSTTPTTNHWVADPASTAAPAEKYQAGASIQCEVCHGTGTPAGTVGNHFGSFTSNVKILKGAELLDSGVCGQCHGRAEGGSTVGYTPDQNLLQFIDAWDKEDVPTEATWNGGINAATGKAWAFFPNGANRNQKHSYYNEWALSGHAYRGAYMNDRENPRVTPYMANHTGHYNALTNGGTQACAKCHTGEGYTVRKGLTLMEDYDLATEPTGMYGQECVTCHIPHGADTAEGEAVGMAVREPEKTPSQLGVVNTSICEDCHNWELDVEEHEFDATPSKVATPSALTGRGGSFMNHATREVYNGVGMFDVEQAGKFMPGVKCEECHMPATKSDFPSSTGLPRYEDRSWKRYSHSMHIMEPGSAAEWGLAAWGDSCSPCHAGQTQEELQGFIEKWQGDAAAAATTAKAAYDAAWARSSIVGTSSALGYILEEPGANELLARAGWNYQAYNSEGSMGAHNPDYIVAGLEAATKMAKSVGGYFDYVATGAATADLDYVVGSVKNGDDSPAAGAKISYTINGTDTYTVIADANGNFSFLYDALDSVTSVKWLRCADPVADIEWIAVP